MLKHEVAAKASATRAKHPSIRKGQSLMNALYELAPLKYAELVGTSADCFYDDNRIAEFYSRL